jgi:putative FmdB family regulatory protein
MARYRVSGHSLANVLLWGFGARTMPIYEYQAKDSGQSCAHCADGFELMQRMSDAPLEACPECAAPLTKLISAPAVGRSESGLDDRAKSAGFHKLERRDKGTYEKKY